MSSILSGVIASFFRRSEKTISEKLSTEEFNQFAQDAADLDAKLNDPATASLAADLKAANDKIAELNGQIAQAAETEKKLTGQIATLTTERDNYKAQHERAAQAGKGEPDEDDNSRGKSTMTSYNAHAMEVYAKANGK